MENRRPQPYYVRILTEKLEIMRDSMSVACMNGVYFIY